MYTIYYILPSQVTASVGLISVRSAVNDRHHMRQGKHKRLFSFVVAFPLWLRIEEAMQGFHSALFCDSPEKFAHAAYGETDESVLPPCSDVNRLYVNAADVR